MSRPHFRCQLLQGGERIGFYEQQRSVMYCARNSSSKKLFCKGGDWNVQEQNPLRFLETGI
jgi:hypothetical protein